MTKKDIITAVLVIGFATFTAYGLSLPSASEPDPSRSSGSKGDQ